MYRKNSPQKKNYHWKHSQAENFTLKNTSKKSPRAKKNPKEKTVEKNLNQLKKLHRKKAHSKENFSYKK